MAIARTLNPQVVKETLAELGVTPAAYVIENRGKRLSMINRRGEHKLVSLVINVGESESAVVARIGAAAGVDTPAFLEI
jgi:hypothetical protein